MQATEVYIEPVHARAMTGPGVAVSDLIESGTYDPLPGAEDVGVVAGPWSIGKKDDLAVLKASFRGEFSLPSDLVMLWQDRHEIIRGIRFTGLVDHLTTTSMSGVGDMRSSYVYASYCDAVWMLPMEVSR